MKQVHHDKLTVLREDEDERYACIQNCRFNTEDVTMLVLAYNRNRFN